MKKHKLRRCASGWRIINVDYPSFSPLPGFPSPQISLRPTYRRIGYALSYVDARRHHTHSHTHTHTHTHEDCILCVVVVVVLHLLFFLSIHSATLYCENKLFAAKLPISVNVVDTVEDQRRPRFFPFLAFVIMSMSNAGSSFRRRCHCQFTVDPKTAAADGACDDQIDAPPLKLTGGGPQRLLFSPFSLKLSPFKFVASWPLLILPLVTP